MCGIIAYIGHQRVELVLVAGLLRLEYRGYDSAGVGVIVPASTTGGEAELVIVKKEGRVMNLQSALGDRDLGATIGIAHTRWATHGPPCDRNSHPHASGMVSGSSDFISVVHNGIIENYQILKTVLIQRGYVFKSDTDTEVIAHLIHSIHAAGDTGTFKSAVCAALSQLEGTFAVAVINAKEPDTLIAARKGSPLVLGIVDGESPGFDASKGNEYFVASDVAAIVEWTNRVVYLEEGEMVVATREGCVVERLGPKGHQRGRSMSVHTVEMDMAAIEKGGYDHFMLKEIMAQPESLRDCMRGRIDALKQGLSLGGLEEHKAKFQSAQRIVLCACGTSWHAALVGEYLIEKFARVPVEVEYASEFRYRDPILRAESDIVMVTSQSGETADTLAAVRHAKAAGVFTFGVVNVIGSTIARETDAGAYLRAGPEIGVASTKAFTAQVTVLAMFALRLGALRGEISDAEMAVHLEELVRIPDMIETTIQGCSAKVEFMSRQFTYAQNFLYLGRGFNFPVALEGALKLKEISYIHAEGYPAAEMKHGPIALIDSMMPVVFIAPNTEEMYQKVVSNFEEVLARGGVCIVITNEGNVDFDDRCEHVIKIPSCSEWLTPLLTVLPLQLLSYYIAKKRGLDVDKPRNLAKSVTVE